MTPPGIKPATFGL